MSQPQPSPNEPTPRDRILDAACEEFAEHGFGGARVDEIARRASVNKAMLYYHVGGKEALYEAVLLRNFDRVQAAVAPAVLSEGSATERLGSVIAAVTKVMKQHPAHPRIVLREIAGGGSNLPTAVLERMLALIGLVRGLLAEGQAAGELRATDPVLTHLLVIGSVLFLTSVAPLRERAAELGQGLDLPDPDEDVAGFVTGVLLHGIAAPAGGGEG